MPHPSEHSPATRPLEQREAPAIAETMSAFSAASRVKILYALARSRLTVDELAAAVEMEPSSVSHQLRILRQLRFVVAEREGRHVRYGLHDHHVADLLAAVRHHLEHAEKGWADAPNMERAETA
jgi:ArsR family transcriptional regulator, nickel/cobalt-responsive transcriptional repressor